MHNIVRLIFCTYSAGLALSTIASLRGQARFHRTNGRPPSRVFGKIQLPKLSQRSFCAVGLAFVAALLIAAAGIESRWFLAVACVLYFPYFGQIADLSYIRRKTNLAPIMLALLLCAPGITAPFSYRSPFWPVLATQIAVASVYLSAGVAKIRNSGLRWALGAQLQAYLAENYLWRDYALTARVATSRYFCTAGSSYTLCVELSFPFAIVSPILALILIASVVGMHISTHILMNIDYLRYWWPNYLPFLVPIVLSAAR